jgi:hypothetical protein
MSPIAIWIAVAALALARMNWQAFHGRHCANRGLGHHAIPVRLRTALCRAFWVQRLHRLLGVWVLHKGARP